MAMGSVIGPASFLRSLASAMLTLAALIAVACVAFAAPADFSEQDLSPPRKANRAPQTPRAAVRSSLKPVQATSYTEDQNATQDENDEDTTDEGQAEGGAPPTSAAAAGNNNAAATSGGDLSYVIREGDSVGAIAGMFHLQAEDIFRHNHLKEDATLHIGQVLRIPNPYTAQVHDLQKQITTLRGLNQEQEHKLQDNDSKAQAYNARIEELSSTNRTLTHEVVTLPWWRRATTVAVTLAVLMLGITLVSLLQWFLVRRRFVAIALANEKLSRLDQRYRLLLARAELRLQQLYGRRRAAVEPSPQAKSPEEFELERLGRELKEIIEDQMSRLGVQLHPPARRSRFREWLASLASPAVVRSDRR
jgi:LysM repeat protein